MVSVELRANKSPPWTACRATKCCCLTAMSNNSDVCPVDATLAWDRMVSKYTLVATRLITKTAYGSKQLYAGLHAGIEGVVYAVLKKAKRDGGIYSIEEEFNKEL